MTKRIFYSTFVVASAMILIVTALILGVMHSYILEERQQEIASEAAYVAAGMEAGGEQYLYSIADTAQSRITLINAQGEVLFDSVLDATLMENHLSRPEVQQALQSGYGEAERASTSTGQTMLYHAKLLQDGTVVRISVVVESVFALLLAMVWPLVAVAVLGIGLSLFIAWRTAKQITKPLNQIDLQTPEKAVIYEELSPLLHRIVTQNKQLEERVAQINLRKQEFDAITSNMQEGLLVLDKDAHVMSYNKAALQLMNVSPPKEHQSIYEINRSEQLRTCVATALAGEHMEQTIKLKNRVCQIFANPVMQNASVMGIIIVLFDVTERERREALRREFTANVSHELKTPLTSISGFAEIIKNGMVQSDDVPKFATNIYNEAQRLILLVRDIIKLSEIDEKQALPEKQAVDLAQLANDALQALLPLAQKRSITLECNAESAIIYGYGPILYEVLYNLCDNAIKYNHDGGRVAVEVKKLEDEVLVTVSDTGMGIAPANHERVFERFFRVNESRSGEIPGSGLGMSIVKHGAQLHGGQVDIESAPGAGTRVLLRFVTN